LNTGKQGFQNNLAAARDPAGGTIDNPEDIMSSGFSMVAQNLPPVTVFSTVLELWQNTLFK
jgi:hypothetical protein